jgi:hypothetical protein
VLGRGEAEFRAFSFGMCFFFFIKKEKSPIKAKTLSVLCFSPPEHSGLREISDEQKQKKLYEK